jgi:integrase
MPRPRLKPHELVPVRKGNKAIVNYGGRSGIYLGPWDEIEDRPSPAAVERLRELVALWTADPAAGATRPAGLSLAELWRLWRESPEAAGRYAEQAARAARFLFGTAAAPGPFRETEAADFGGEQVRTFQRALCAAGLSRDSVTKTVGCVRKCLAWGLVGRHVGYDQYRAAELVPPPAKGQVKEATARRAADWEDVAAVLPRLSPPLAAVVRLLWHTGARPTELLTLRAGDVRRGGVVRAVSGVRIDLGRLKVWAAVKGEHKTDDGGYDRVIFFGPKARKVLAPILAARTPGEYLFRPADGREWDLARKRTRRTPGGGGSKKAVKGGAAERAPGERYDYHALTTAVRRACEAVGVRWTAYEVRHAAGVLVQQRFGREAARAFLGHQVGGVTERYAGRDLEAAAKVARAWG